MTIKKKSDSGEGFPDMETLRSVHEAYREIAAGKADTLTEVAEHLKMDASLLNRRIDRFERGINRQGADPKLKVFARGRGKKTRANEDEQVVQLMSDLAEVVNGYTRVSQARLRPMTVRFASSLAACSAFAPRLLGDTELSHVAFDLMHAKPRTLRRILDRNACDYALVAVSKKFDKDHESVVHYVELPMALITPRGAVPENSSVKWDKLHKHGLPLALLRDEPDRYPMPKYPTHLLDGETVVHRLASTSLCHSVVMDGGAMTISLPQFFSQRQREYLNIVWDDELDSVGYALLASSEVRNADGPRSRVLKLVEDKAIDFMKRLDEGVKYHSSTLTMYHVTHTDRPVWLKGKIDWRQDDKTISGVYRIQERGPDGAPGDESTYQLKGHLTTLGGEDRVHVACRAICSRSQDEFVLELTAASEKKLGEHLTGIWAGRPTWHRLDRFGSYVGRVVISSRDDVDPAELNHLVERNTTDHQIVPSRTPTEVFDWRPC